MTKKKILAIDDQEDNLISLEAIFKHYLPGCELITALSGENGIRLAGQEMPDAIILDIIMPEMDGYQVCNLLKENEKTRIIPIMMLTAIKTDTESMVRGLESGADAFLSKPFDPVELTAQIKVLLRIKDNEDRLRDKHKMLEDIVSERTRELVSSNRELTREIERRKKTEKELREAVERAKEADKIKTNFLASISHEFRTPLNAIIGFSDIMDSDTSTEEIEQYAGMINHSGQILLSMVEDLFDITLLDSGVMKIKNEAFTLRNLCESINKTVHELQVKLNREELDFVCNIPEIIIDKKVSSDRAKIEKILSNLISNALKFTEKGKVEFGLSEPVNNKPDSLDFYIKDTGIGIDKQDQEKIFQKFTQVDNSFAKKYGGLGIGLTVTDKMVKLFGGQINVTSDPGRGSLFKLTIPLPEKAGESEDMQAEERFKILSARNILVVEDDDSSFQLLNIWLQKAGFRTARALNGKEAVDLCNKNNDIDLVLMDINMPVMNGYDSTRIITKQRPEIPVIAQTAYAVSGSLEKAREAGCREVLSKPLKKTELLKTITAYCS
ncbi:MAG: response regulator [Bacteroidales bacterium]|nr:response regulator [Bacteroidales bacterium]